MKITLNGTKKQEPPTYFIWKIHGVSGQEFPWFPNLLATSATAACPKIILSTENPSRWHQRLLSIWNLQIAWNMALKIGKMISFRKSQSFKTESLNMKLGNYFSGHLQFWYYLDIPYIDFTRVYDIADVSCLQFRWLHPSSEQVI